MSDIQGINGLPSAAAPAAGPGKADAVPAPKVTAVPTPVAPKIDPQQLRQQIQEAVKQLNQQMQRTNTALGFSYDEAVSRSVVTVRNSESGEVVRKIPTDAVLNVAHSIESLKGVLYNKKA